MSSFIITCVSFVTSPSHFHLHGICCSHTCTYGLITYVSHINTISPPRLSLNYQNQTRTFLLDYSIKNSFAVHRFVRPQLHEIIFHLQFGCVLSCSCLCSSLRRQGLPFLARSTWSVTWLITRGAMVLRLQGSIFRSEAGSVCHSPPQR